MASCRSMRTPRGGGDNIDTTLAEHFPLRVTERIKTRSPNDTAARHIY